MKDARSLKAEEQEKLRIEAVNKVLQGSNQTQVAKQLGVKRQTINRWIQTYRNEEQSALKAKPKGRPFSGSAFEDGEDAMKEFIIQTVVAETPLKYFSLDLGYGWIERMITTEERDKDSLWTQERIRELIKNQFDVDVSVRTVERWLHKWGFTPPIPIRPASAQNAQQELRDWFKNEYPHILREAKKEKAEIHWGDRRRLCSEQIIFSTITNRGVWRFRVFSKQLTEKVFLEFLIRLCLSVEKKVHLIVNNHSIYKSRQINNWLKQNASKIRLIISPVNIPNLDSDELLPLNIKLNALRKQHDEDLEMIEIS